MYTRPFCAVSILQIIHKKKTRLPVVFTFRFRCTRITLSIENRLRIANKAVYTSWNEIEMTIKRVPKETMNPLYCL